MEVSFGELLKDWRGRRRISQLDLALAANVSARHIAFRSPVVDGRSGARHVDGAWTPWP